ncbi:hypothetical protein Tco_0532826 [Tanacetum coccineum]
MARCVCSHSTVSRTEPKNIKEAMADSAWIESMQETSSVLIGLDVWEIIVQTHFANIVINLKWLWKIHVTRINTAFSNNFSSCAYGICSKEGIDSKSHFALVASVGSCMVLFICEIYYPRRIIVHATCYCARYQAKPTEKHLIAVKRIFRYLKDSINMGLWYPKDTGFELTAFSDSDHAGCLDSLEGEYVSLSAFLLPHNFVLWLRTQLTDYGFHFDKIPMYCDSKAAIAISCNPVQHSRTKHIDVRYHFIKEQVEKGIVELFFVGTEYQLADLFTKALSEDRFKYLVRRLGMRCLTPDELEVLAIESA